jgi:hypothetical protein
MFFEKPCLADLFQCYRQIYIYLQGFMTFFYILDLTSYYFFFRFLNFLQFFIFFNVCIRFFYIYIFFHIS